MASSHGRDYAWTMNDWLFELPARASLPILGQTARWPVRRVLCVGQNYADHVREMGGDPNRAQPFFFAKPGDAVVSDGDDVTYPSATTNLHHEVELVCAIGTDGQDVSPDDAPALIAGWAVGVDLTRRDLQAAAKAAGKPWDAAKGFDQSAPVGSILLGALPEPAGAISLSVNGQARQASTLDHMIWSPAEVVAQASRLWRLMPGDLIFTGTPEGVGPLVAGDRIDASIAGLPLLSFTMRTP